MGGVFIGMPSMKHSFQSSELFLSTKGRWCDIITDLCVLSESVWLPWRHVLGEEEKVLHLKDLILL